MAPPSERTTNEEKTQPRTDRSTSSISLSGDKLLVDGIAVLSDVPANVTFRSFASSSSNAPSHLLHRVASHAHNGGFLGFSSSVASDRHVLPVGRFAGRSFLSVFRFKTWWSTMWVGNSGSDLQMETQWLLLDVPEIKQYLLVLPIIEGGFRSALHPGNAGRFTLSAESGSTSVTTSSLDTIAYVHVSDDPYALMENAYAAVRVHLGTFKLLEEKPVPPVVDKFGWCTWDAFYLAVEPVGVTRGIEELVNGGVPPRFLIIDDGWQSINMDWDLDHKKDTVNLVLGGTQMNGRLHSFKECNKFARYKGGAILAPNSLPYDPNRPKRLISKAIQLEQVEKARLKAAKSGLKDLSWFNDEMGRLGLELSRMLEEKEEEEDGHEGVGDGCPVDFGMGAFVKDLRIKFKRLDDVYVWQALCGAWGGVRPGATHLDSKLVGVTVSPGLDGSMEDLAVVKIVEGGIGLVRPDQAADLFDSMHSYLAGCGITGVKVDVMHTLEYVCEEYRGRVELAKAYYDGLTKSLVKNFNGTGLLSSMQQCNDFFFLGTSQISFGRVGDDFWFQDPNGDPMGQYWLQGIHMIHCAYNSMWMGQIIQPDWDMFQSDHICAAFHAGSRAICGGPIYVSDSLGGHDFDLLRSLVYPDGTIPKCQYFALPTRDCLFKNPAFDGETILKIWNFNKFGGVIGAFNCQGAGWDPQERRIRGYPHRYKPISGTLHVNDVEWNRKKAFSIMGNAEEYVMHLNQAGSLILMAIESDPISIALQPSSFEIFTIVPIKKLGQRVKFAPIGLVNMLNCGGTIVEQEYMEVGSEVGASVKVKGGGKFLAYSSAKPRRCTVDGVEADFEYREEDHSVALVLRWNEDSMGISQVEFVY